MPTYEGLRLKILEIKRIKFAEKRKKLLKNTKFTIISNNCWGGMMYESYNLQKQSPTVGLYFMASDYIKFISDLQGYIKKDLHFISASDSKWKDSAEIKNDKLFGTYPIGKLGDIEIFFLHYSNEEEALKKWNRRVARINWDKLLVKFNDQNGCTRDDLKKFIELPYKNKVFFTSNKWEGIDDSTIVRIKQFPKHNYIMASYEPFGKNKYLNLEGMINSL